MPYSCEYAFLLYGWSYVLETEPTSKVELGGIAQAEGRRFQQWIDAKASLFPTANSSYGFSLGSPKDSRSLSLLLHRPALSLSTCQSLSNSFPLSFRPFPIEVYLRNSSSPFYWILQRERCFRSKHFHAVMIHNVLSKAYLTVIELSRRNLLLRSASSLSRERVCGVITRYR